MGTLVMMGAMILKTQMDRKMKMTAEEAVGTPTTPLKAGP